MITIEKLKGTIIKDLNLEDITSDDIEDNMQIFGDDGLGLDSVDAIELTLIIEKEFGVKITNLAKAEEIFASCASLTTYINDQLDN
jgi:acyl carrier protein